MTKLSIFWKTHRLGMVYGVIWGMIALRLLSGVLHQHPELRWTFFMSAIIAGLAVTAIMRFRLKGRSEGVALWQAPLSLIIGMTFFGMISSLLEALWKSAHGVIARPTLVGLILDNPLKTLIPLILIGTPLVFLASLNTWHLWKQVNRQQALNP